MEEWGGERRGGEERGREGRSCDMRQLEATQCAAWTLYVLVSAVSEPERPKLGSSFAGAFSAG